MTPIEAYQRHGAAWARLRNKQVVERAWLDRFCAMLPNGGAVLDIGCGSGMPIGRELVARGFELIGVDAAPTMLSLFRRNLPHAPAHPHDSPIIALMHRGVVSLSRTALLQRCELWPEIYSRKMLRSDRGYRPHPKLFQIDLEAVILTPDRASRLNAVSMDQIV